MIDIQAAVEALRTGEEARRRQVVDELGSARRPEAVPPLLMAVADESWPVRQAAAEHLAAFDPETVLPALESALRDDEDAGARNAAMEIYVKMGTAVVPPLLALLGDADEEVRNFAAVMLGSLRDARAVMPLVAALRSEAWLQYPAITALGEIGDPRATQALLELMDDELLRGPVMEALGRLAGREALPHLVPRLYDADAALRNIAIQAVVAIEQRATAGGDSLDPEVQAALRREDLVDHLIATLGDDEPQNRRTAAITLGWLKEPRAVRPLVERLSEPALQEYVTHALVSIGFRDEEAYRYGLGHPDDTVRQATLRCLSWIAPPQGPELVAPLVQDPSPEVRAGARPESPAQPRAARRTSTVSCWRRASSRASRPRRPLACLRSSPVIPDDTRIRTAAICAAAW